MINLTQEKVDEIKKQLGCVGLVIIATDSQIPCPDGRAGMQCEHPHEVNVFIDGLSMGGIMEILSEQYEKIISEE